MNRTALILRKIIVIAVVLSLLAGCLAGCGGSTPAPANNNSANSNPSGQSNTANNVSENTAEPEKPVYKSSKETAALLEEAERYYYGVPGETKVDLVKAKELYQKALEKGSPLAAYMMSMLVLQEFAQQNDFSSDEWKKVQEEQDSWETLAILAGYQAAKEGDPESCVMMGIFAVGSKEPLDGVPYLETAVTAGEPYATMAMIALGDLYQKKNTKE